MLRSTRSIPLRLALAVALSALAHPVGADAQQQISQPPITITGEVGRQHEQQQQQQQQWFQQQQQWQQQPQQDQSEQQRRQWEEQRRRQEQAAREAHRARWPQVGAGGIIESGLALAELEGKLESEFGADVHDYSAYENLPGYIVEIGEGSVTIEALEALDVWGEELPAPAQLPFVSTAALYHHEAEYYFVGDLVRYLRQSDHPRAQRLRARAERRMQALLAMESERMRREAAAYAPFGPQTATQRHVRAVLERGQRVLTDVERRFDAGLPTPFSNRDAIQTAKLLFTLNAQAAARVSNPHSRLHHRFRSEYGADPDRVAMAYASTASDIVDFARGVTEGVTTTFVGLAEGALSVYRFTTYALDDPYAAMDLAWETIANLEPERVAAAVQHHLVHSYTQLRDGSPAEKGRVVGRIVTDIVLGATLANFLGNYQRFARTVGTSFVGRVDLLTDLARPAPHRIASRGRILADVKRTGPRRVGPAARFATRLPDADGQLRHIFRDAAGHLRDTPSNRRLLLDVADDPAATLGTDRFGNVWSARVRPDGTQVWTQTRNGVLRNGGVNATPRRFDRRTGLSGGS